MSEDSSLHYQFLISDMTRLATEAISWRNSEAVWRDRSDWLDLQLGRCADHAFAEKFSQGCPVPGAHTTDYLQRVCELSCGHRFLAGIRFRGSNANHPFIDLLATTWGEGKLEEVWEVASQRWSVFAPPKLRVLTATPPSGLGFHIELDQRIIAGRLGDLVHRSLPQKADSVQLVRCTPMEAVETVKLGYSTLPEPIESLVHAATEEELAWCEKYGLLRRVLVDGVVAGVIAVDSKAEFGLDGFVVVEQVLTASFRGQGLAPGVQRAIIDELAANNPGNALFGTIAHRNGPSRATALRTGRTEVAAYWFLRPVTAAEP